MVNLSAMTGLEVGGEEIFAGAEMTDWLADCCLRWKEEKDAGWHVLTGEITFVRRMRYKSIRIISPDHLVFL